MQSNCAMIGRLMVSPPLVHAVVFYSKPCNDMQARRVHHNELRDFEAELLSMACSDVEVDSTGFEPMTSAIPVQSTTPASQRSWVRIPLSHLNFSGS